MEKAVEKRRGRKAVDSGGLEIPSRIPAPKQINTLAYGPVPRFSLIWAALVGKKCNRMCNTKNLVQQRLVSGGAKLKLTFASVCGMFTDCLRRKDEGATSSANPKPGFEVVNPYRKLRSYPREHDR